MTLRGRLSISEFAIAIEGAIGFTVLYSRLGEAIALPSTIDRIRARQVATPMSESTASESGTPQNRPTDRDAAPGAIEFLIAEYNEISEDTRRLRQEGIARLNFSIAMTSSVLAALAFLSQSQVLTGIFFRAVTIGVLLLLFFASLDTLRFAIARDINTDTNRRATARIRRFFATQNPKIQQYLTWQCHDEPTHLVARNRSNVRLTAQYILSFLSALIAGLAANSIGVNPAVATAIGAVGLLVSFAVLQGYATKQFSQARLEAKKSIRFPETLDEF
jgi:hypothetical protein